MRHFWFLCTLVIFSNPSFAAQWQCQSAGGWLLDTQGRATQLPGDPNDNYVIAFVPPNKMQILQSSDPLDYEIYQYLTWVQIGNSFHGTGMFTLDGATFNVTESIDDTKAVVAAVVSGHPELVASMGQNTCRRIK